MDVNKLLKAAGFEWDDGNIDKNWISNLKPSTKTISIRLPEIVLEELKMLANKRDVPYQSLLKIFLVEKIEEQLRHKSVA